MSPTTTLSRLRELGLALTITAIAAAAVLLSATDSRPGSLSAPNASAFTGDAVFVPGAAHVTGAANTNWRTDLEVFNPDQSPALFEVSLLEKDESNSTPVTLPFQLSGGRTARYEDVLHTMFGYTGSAALRVTATSGRVIVSSRTFNLTDDGTYGQYIGGALEERAIQHGEQARIIQLSQSNDNDSGYRTNVGFVNTTGANAVVQVDLHGWDGALLGSRSYTLEPFTYTQRDRIFRAVTSDEVADGYAVVRVLTPEAAVFAYASVVDNRTGDPIFIPAAVVPGAAAPTATPTGPPSTPSPPAPTATPTATPTPTQPAAQVNLTPFQPQGWDGPLVVSGQAGTTTSGGLVGGQDSYVDWALLNEGPDDAVFSAGQSIVRLDVDGTPLVQWLDPDADYVIEAGYYVYVLDYALEGLSAGTHTLTMTGDPDGAVPETDEGDNSASYTGTWSGSNAAGRPFRAMAASGSLGKARRPGLQAGPNRPRGARERAAKERWAAARSGSSSAAATVLTAGEPLYIPATAHVAGAAGTNWRTDVELHNPGSTAGRYEVALLPRNQANPTPTTVEYTVQPGRCLRLNDALYSLFGFEGGASLRITPLVGDLVVTSRTYNLTGQGTYGQFIGGTAASEALGDGEAGALIQLTHHRGTATGFRTNIGFVNCGGTGITVRADLYRSDGSLLGTRSWGLEPYMHRQIDRVFESVSQTNVADGYIIVSTTTTGGRFLAYASVVDNATGDPVYIPAAPVGAPSPPQTPTPGQTGTATPTMTPAVPPGTPMDPRTTADWVFDVLGSIEPGGFFDVEQQIATFQQLGLDASLNLLVTQFPDVVSRTPDGIALDFGSAYVLDDGTVVSGQLEQSLSVVLNTPTRLEVDTVITQQNLQVNGAYPLIDELSGGARLDIDSQGHVAGRYTFTGVDASPVKSTTNRVTGDVEVDTELCPNYPIGGSVTVVRGEDEHVFTFTDACDGSYGYLGPGSTGDVAFRLRWDGPEDLDIYVREPGGEMIWFANPMSATGGQLDVDSNSACSVHDPQPTENVFWPVGQAPHGTYEFWAELWSDCDGSQTPAFTFYVFEGAEVVQEIPGVIADGTSPHYTHVY